MHKLFFGPALLAAWLLCGSSAVAQVAEWGRYGAWSVHQVEEEGRRWCNLVTAVSGKDRGYNLYIDPLHDDPEIALAFYLLHHETGVEPGVGENGQLAADIAVDGGEPYRASLVRNRDWIRVAAAYPEGPQLVDGMKAGIHLYLRVPWTEFRVGLRGFTRALREYEACERKIADGA